MTVPVATWHCSQMTLSRDGKLAANRREVHMTPPWDGNFVANRRPTAHQGVSPGNTATWQHRNVMETPTKLTHGDFFLYKTYTFYWGFAVPPRTTLSCRTPCRTLRSVHRFQSRRRTWWQNEGQIPRGSWRYCRPSSSRLPARRRQCSCPPRRTLRAVVTNVELFAHNHSNINCGPHNRNENRN